jgi:hypothetical protein
MSEKEPKSNPADRLKTLLGVENLRVIEGTRARPTDSRKNTFR